MPSTDRITAPGKSQAAAIRLSLMLLGAGVMHFVIPKRFDSVIPSRFPGSARTYTYASGVANLGVGAGLAIPRTRKVSSGLAVILFVAYMPAKIKLAVDFWRSEQLPMPAKIGGLVQLVWQIPLATESLKARRNAP